MSLYHHFSEVLNLPKEAHSDYLANLADTGLKVELEQLLQQHNAIEQATGWHDLVAEQVAHITGDHQLNDLLGTLIGPYQLTDIIGRGGMSVVYRAERIDGTMKQSVAIKFLMPSIMQLTGSDLAHSEAQILANLHHPHVTQVYDAGRTESGLSYFVMELLQGLPIDQYCQQNNLTTHDKIQLFLTLADAIKSAHMLHVVHADIKPSNVLVTHDGVVKVLDFGIGKLIHDQADSKQTQVQKQYLQALSLPYAAPEQITEFNSTPQGDQYSLAVLLYQLLVERLPFDIEGGTKQELIRQKCSGQALPLSHHLTGVKDKLKHSGDLQFILNKALHADPDKRYQNVSELQSELHRYLRHLPLNDKRHSYVYQFAKWLRRAPAQASVFAVLVVSSCAFYLQNIEIKQERQTAEQVAEQLIGIFQLTNPNLADKPNLTAKEMLLRGFKNIHEDALIKQEAKNKLLISIGESLYGLGHRRSAIPLIEKVAQQSDLKVNDFDMYFRANSLLAKARNGIGDAYVAQDIVQSLLRDVEAKSDSFSGTLSGYMDILYSRGYDYSAQGIEQLSQFIQGAGAGDEQLIALKIKRYEELKSTAVNALFYQSSGYDEYLQALDAVTELGDEIRQEIKPSHDDFPYFMTTLVGHYKELGHDCVGCRQRVIDAIPLFQQKYGNQHRMIEYVLQNISWIAEYEEDYATAIEYSTKLQALAAQNWGEESMDYLQSYMELIQYHTSFGHVEQAENMLYKAEQLFKQVIRKTPDAQVMAAYFYGLDSAIAFFETTQQFEKAPPYVVEAAHVLKNAPYLARSEHFVIHTMLNEARKIFIQQGSQASIDYLHSREPEFAYPNNFELTLELGRQYHLIGAADKSLPYFEQAQAAIANFAQLLPVIYHQNVSLQYSKALLAAGKVKKALPLLQQAYDFNYNINPSPSNFWLRLILDIATRNGIAADLIAPSGQHLNEVDHK